MGHIVSASLTFQTKWRLVTLVVCTSKKNTTANLVGHLCIPQLLRTAQYCVPLHCAPTELLFEETLLCFACVDLQRRCICVQGAYCELQNFVALLLAPAEALIDIPLQEAGVHLELVQLGGQERVELQADRQMRRLPAKGGSAAGKPLHW